MIVIDASAIVKLVINEEGSVRAGKEIQMAIGRGEVVVSPDIALAETLNSIWKHCRILKDLSVDELDQRLDMTLLVWNKITKIDTEKLAEEALGVAARHGITAYDALYIAASRSNNAALLTFDRKLMDKAKELDIALL